MLTGDEETKPDASEINSNGQSIFDLIDLENSRFMRRKEEINQFNLENERIHNQQMVLIWASFGVPNKDMPMIHKEKQPLTAKEKLVIKERVKEWADSRRASRHKRRTK